MTSNNKKDIDHTRPTHARLAAIRTGVSTLSTCRRLFMLGNNLNLIEDLDDTTAAQIEKINPTLLLLNIGSNDLANLCCIDTATCEQLADSAVEFAESIGNTPTVVFYSVIPRSKRISSSPEVFLENMKAFNAKLQDLCAPFTKIHYERMRGFYSDATNQSRKVDEWSDDGIHLRTHDKNGKPASMPTYQKRLKHTILAHVP